jgi:ParB-like chromosome segregation protein Spo0J
MAESLSVVQLDPSTLKNYHLNIKIYGDHISPEFVESVKGGIESPLTVCRSRLPELDGVVMKGRRRRMAAIIHDMKTVPCFVVQCDDVLDFEEKMLVDNIRNETTVEERVRMYDELKRIGVERGKRAQKSNLKAGKTDDSPEPPNLTPRRNKGEKCDSRQKAASQAGLKPSTAEKAAEVVKAADEMKANGHPEKAAEVLETLNTKSVNAAAKLVNGSKPEENEDDSIPKHLQPVVDSLKEIASAVTNIGKLREQIRKICQGPGGGKLNRLWGDMERMLQQISVNMKSYRFWSACPECKITDKQQKADENCKMCRGHGWIAKTNGLSDHHKTWLRERGYDV